MVDFRIEAGKGRMSHFIKNMEDIYQERYSNQLEWAPSDKVLNTLNVKVNNDSNEL